MKPMFKIHLGLILGFPVVFIAVVITGFLSHNEMSVFLPPCYFFTYEYLIMEFLKGNYLSKEQEEFEDKTYEEFMRFSSYCYRRLLKVFRVICIIAIPIFWGLAVAECTGII